MRVGCGLPYTPSLATVLCVALFFFFIIYWTNYISWFATVNSITLLILIIWYVLCIIECHFFGNTYYDGNWKEKIYDICIHGLSDYIINLWKGSPVTEDEIHASFYIQEEKNNNCLSFFFCMVSCHRERKQYIPVPIKIFYAICIYCIIIFMYCTVC